MNDVVLFNRFLQSEIDADMLAVVHGVGLSQRLDGLGDWMRRKRFGSVREFRGLLSVPADADETIYERAGCVSALRDANETAYGPWR